MVNLNVLKRKVVVAVQNGVDVTLNHPLNQHLAGLLFVEMPATSSSSLTPR